MVNIAKDNHQEGTEVQKRKFQELKSDPRSSKKSAAPLVLTAEVGHASLGFELARENSHQHAVIFCTAVLL